LWSRKWRESWKRDREEELVLAVVQEKVLSESKEKSQSAQRRPRERVRKGSAGLLEKKDSQARGVLVFDFHLLLPPLSPYSCYSMPCTVAL
jgi:hypothetical protein